jgi:hypothetical protein
VFIPCSFAAAREYALPLRTIVLAHHMSPTRACPHCGHSMPEQAKFCGQCGGVSEMGPPTDPAPAPSAIARAITDTNSDPKSHTMIEFSAPAPVSTVDASSPASRAFAQTMPAQMAVAAADAAPPRVSAPTPSAPRLATDKRTMMGIAASDLFDPTRSAHPAPGEGSAPAPPAPAPTDAPRMRPARTMMGVAIPGIAPLRAGEGGAASLAAPPAKDAMRPMGSENRTMMGVAVPGVAPRSSSAASPSGPSARRLPASPPVDIVPPPPPLVDHEAAPSAPMLAPKRGVPIALVAILGAIVLVVGGLVIAMLWRGAPPLTAKPELDADGREVLHLRCDGCEDGTVADLNGAKATFTKSEASLPLVVPLHVGQNPLSVHVVRPGNREHTAKLTVPVLFRIRPDLSTLAAATPAISVRVEAAPGTDVRVDGKPVALDASGAGVYAVDIAADVEGQSDQSRLVKKEIPYVVTPKGGAASSGVVTAQVNVVPLRLLTPTSHALIDTTSFIVSGQAVKGSTVTVNGQAVPVDALGVFEQSVPAPAVGDVAVEIRASLSSYAPRTTHVTVKRVANLDAEAKLLEAAKPAGYDAVAGAVASKVGQPFIAEGEVIDSKIERHQTTILMSDRRGCAKGPCVVSVVVGHDEPLARGDALRVYGRVMGGVQAKDATLPQIEADFVLKGKAR